MKGLAAAIAEGRVSGRLWLYPRYDCNLACAYCLTESSPNAERRQLGADKMVEIARQGRGLGFTGLGLTGGEPLLDRELPALLARLTAILPTVVNTNGYLLAGERLEAITALADRPLTIQLSLDDPEPEPNDLLRGERSYEVATRLIPELVARGLHVRVASSLEEAEPGRVERLRAQVLELGLGPDDHFVRPLVARGRAVDAGLGVRAVLENLPPELTLTANGAFWNPFAPTVRGGRLDIDLLLTRTLLPLSVPVNAMMELVDGMPAGNDALLDIR